MMKKVFFLLMTTMFFIACNPTPNKEARLRKLEAESITYEENVEELEQKIEVLEQANEDLKIRIKELEGE